MAVHLLEGLEQTKLQLKKLWEEDNGKVRMNAMMTAEVLKEDRKFEKSFYEPGTGGLRVTNTNSQLEFIMSLYYDGMGDTVLEATFLPLYHSNGMTMSDITDVEIEFIKGEDDQPPVRIIRLFNDENKEEPKFTGVIHEAWLKN